MNEKVPSEHESIIMDLDHFCEDHINQVEDFNIPVLNMVSVTIEALLSHPKFYEIAFRVRNGYGPPYDSSEIDSLENIDIPESEEPGIQHINDTIREVEPLCCYLEEVSEYDIFIKAIAKQAEKSDKWTS